MNLTVDSVGIFHINFSIKGLKFLQGNISNTVYAAGKEDQRWRSLEMVQECSSFHWVLDLASCSMLDAGN